MIASDTLTLGGGLLDRAAHLRTQADLLAAHPSARVLPMWRGHPLLRKGYTGAATEIDAALSLVPAGHEMLAEVEALVFLGCAGGAPHFAAALPDRAPPVAPGDGDPAEPCPPECGDGVFADLRMVMTQLGALDAELAATARAVLGWHRSHRFCAACGTQSQPAQGGWLRQCPACGTRHFPRTDPVVIMLITHGPHVLLGRSPGWPEGMYSLLAGFVEPGETIDAASRREAMEEAGTELGAVRYLACQPWPFPSSLMLATQAEARSRDLCLDPVEIEDARWLTREDLVDVIAGLHRDIVPPRKGAIAGIILHNWLADRLD